MAVRHLDIEFTNGFQGVAKMPNVDVKIGMGEGEALPYDLLFSALASCLYSTFLDINEKKKIAFDNCTIKVSGEKRTEIPATLEWVNVEFAITGVDESKQKGVEKAAELSTKYCSIYQTVAQVAEMSVNVTYN